MPAAFDRCVKKVKAKGTGNPYAICRASMGTDKQIKARSKSKGKKK